MSVFNITIFHYKECPEKGVVFKKASVNVFDIVSVRIPDSVLSEFADVYTGEKKVAFRHRFPYEVVLTSGDVYFCSQEHSEVLKCFIEFRDFMLEKFNKGVVL